MLKPQRTTASAAVGAARHCEVCRCMLAGGEGALLTYAMKAQFNLIDPNEGRLPWDHFGRDLWEDDRG